MVHGRNPQLFFCSAQQEQTTIHDNLLLRATPSIGLLHRIHEQRVYGVARDALRADDQHHIVLGGDVVLVSELRGQVIYVATFSHGKPIRLQWFI